MPAVVPTINRRAPVKAPDRCPFCNGTKVAPKGTRAKKLEAVRVYRCGPRALCNKTYSLNEILEALTTYNRGLSLFKPLILGGVTIVLVSIAAAALSARPVLKLHPMVVFERR
jgi:hypothetical protein